MLSAKIPVGVAVDGYKILYPSAAVVGDPNGATTYEKLVSLISTLAPAFMGLGPSIQLKRLVLNRMK